MITEQKKHDVIVMYKGNDGVLQSMAYRRENGSAVAPAVTGFGGHVDSEPAFLLDVKPREWRSE